MIAKGHYGKAIEIPYVFTDRVVGESKLNQKEIFNYLKQLRKLYFGAHPSGGEEVVSPTPEWLRIRRGKDADARDAALWSKCPVCGEVLYRRDLAANLYVCTKCGHHFRMGAYDRISSIVDGDFTEVGADILPGDPLGWADKKSYPVKLSGDREKSGLSEARRVRVRRRSAATTWRSASWISTFAAGRWAPSSANASRCCSKKRANAAFRASSLRHRAARGWKKACSR